MTIETSYRRDLHTIVVTDAAKKTTTLVRLRGRPLQSGAGNAHLTAAHMTYVRGGVTALKNKYGRDRVRDGSPKTHAAPSGNPPNAKAKPRHQKVPNKKTSGRS